MQKHLQPLQAAEGEIRSFTAGAERDMLSSHISPIQIETLRHCIRGFTCREIADKFGLSVSGVRRNISDMIEKGGFNNKEDPTTTAAENKPVVTTLRDTK